MKIFKKFLVPFLALFIFFGTNSLLVPVKQADASTNTSEISAIETIAKNTPQILLGRDKKEWSDVSVINEKPLYDFNDQLIAYSVDLKSNINDEKAFAIISTSENDGPIYEFAKDTFSPYDGSTDAGIFDGVGSYFLHHSDGKYSNMISKVKLTDADVTKYKAISKAKKYISGKPDDAKNIRAYLKQTPTVTTNTTSVQPNSILAYKVLAVPDYYWYKGCSPTSASMVLKYMYSSKLASVSQNTLITQLATAMHTDSSGGTYPGDIPIGITSVMSSYGVSVTSTNRCSGSLSLATSRLPPNSSNYVI